MPMRAPSGTLAVTRGAGSKGDIDTPFSPVVLTPASFPHPVVRMRVRETHISWVLLTGEFAYKIKKSVKLDFIDTSTLARRHHLCSEELRLNRRLASALYLDVVPIAREGSSMRVGGHDQVVEYAVRMRQFAARQELPSLLARGEVSARELVDLAERVAQFHCGLPEAPTTRDFPNTRNLHDAVLGNLATLISNLGSDTLSPEMVRVVDWTREYLANSLGLLQSREEQACIRECHGDLHTGNIVRWGGRLVPFDCLEFDPKLRWIDVMNDTAFLVMDLCAHGRADLAFIFVNAYLERTGDYAGIRHLAFYSVYRSMVRAMVDSVGANQDLAHRSKMKMRVQMRVQAATAYLDRPSPALLIMHGLSGAGKSWLSDRLASKFGAIRIRSDVERKRLAGIEGRFDSSADFRQGIYEPNITRRTYARLLESAQSCLEGGFHVIVDAAFLEAKNRLLFSALAARLGCRFIILACEASHSILVERLQKRARLRSDPSDAGVEILDRQPQIRDPFSAAEQAHAIRIDTTGPDACQRAFTAVRDRLKPAAG
jgi:uncharacterized protein